MISRAQCQGTQISELVATGGLSSPLMGNPRPSPLCWSTAGVKTWLQSRLPIFSGPFQRIGWWQSPLVLGRIPNVCVWEIGRIALNSGWSWVQSMPMGLWSSLPVSSRRPPDYVFLRSRNFRKISRISDRIVWQIKVYWLESSTHICWFLCNAFPGLFAFQYRWIIVSIQNYVVKSHRALMFDIAHESNVEWNRCMSACKSCLHVDRACM